MNAATRVGVVHVHSDWSRDGRDPLDRIRDWALERGVTFVGLTDHAEDFEPELWDEYLAECTRLSDARVQLIPGLEFRFPRLSGVHLLALGLRAWIEPTSIDEFFAAAPECVGLTVLAHPVLADHRVPDVVANHIGAIEVWNTSYNSPLAADPQAFRLVRSLRATRPEVVAIAGLDQHDANYDGGTRVLIDPNEADAIAALAAGRFTNQGRTMRFGPDAAISPAQLRTLDAAWWTWSAMRRVGRTRRWLFGAARRR